MLKMAVLDRKLPFVEVIVQHPEIDVNLKDEYGVNPLYHAAELNYDDLLEFLMSCTRKGKKKDDSGGDKQDWLLTDPTHLHALTGLNAL